MEPRTISPPKPPPGTPAPHAQHTHRGARDRPYLPAQLRAAEELVHGRAPPPNVRRVVAFLLLLLFLVGVQAAVPLPEADPLLSGGGAGAELERMGVHTSHFCIYSLK